MLSSGNILENRSVLGTSQEPRADRFLTHRLGECQKRSFDGMSDKTAAFTGSVGEVLAEPLVAGVSAEKGPFEMDIICALSKVDESPSD